MTQKNQKKLDQVVKLIVKKFKPEKIILFGSYAWGKPNEDSDVDLFIIKETDNTRETAMEIDGSIFPRPFPIDLIVYRPENVKKRIVMNDFFIQDVISKGKILYEK
ncbi:nucleotidyltransferase domain-containing protein [Patescibacteria group bacterium]|nr:nucleotidyltransferase domain-containing protein [Patescibacteria group bacterium]